MLAALIAAVVGSIAWMINSLATIFTLGFSTKFTGGDNDIEHDEIGDGAARSANEKQRALIGRITSIAVITITNITAKPLLGSSNQAYQFVHEFSGF